MNSESMPDKPQFTETNIEDVFQKIVSSDNDLKNYYTAYLAEEYKEEPERLPYYDIGRIADFIRERYTSNQTQNFKILFNNIEDILQNCDQYVAGLIVIGLFEDIQNPGGINYYTHFDKWLNPLSKKSWDEVIDFWEGTEWRNKK